ncbi:MAG: S-methyl-5-thioribose-1-phosphate isomerase [Gammaproteobacteria bacterium]|nr:S-methyl-5-thioribose-1-phosphate isomerase [Gammaproteobacteria bacterium]
MLINGKKTHTIWVNEKTGTVQIYDQRELPHQIKIVDLNTSTDAFHAIKDMLIRGAPLIGVTAAYGVYLAAKEKSTLDYIKERVALLRTSRPTAINLNWALDKMLSGLSQSSNLEADALALANDIKQKEIDISFNIGEHGAQIIEKIYKNKNGGTVNVLTHCNAGWLASIDWGMSSSPVFRARDNGIETHVWVDETRPRNQGANLTAFEYEQENIAHTLIVDNAGGHLMQHGMVDIVITGTDRTTRQGDVANKIGTYLKALAAYDNNVPFYVALPSSSIDWSIRDGLKDIPIEERDQNEVKYIQGKGKKGIEAVLICPENTVASNYGFDVTPARLVTGFITERGVCEASEAGLLSLFPEMK